jgi:hypothetical protein
LEQQPSPEKIATPELNKPNLNKDKKEEVQMIKPTLPKQEEPKNVVHKEKEPIKTHPVGAHADKLTTIADKEEEDFIKHVADIHRS